MEAIDPKRLADRLLRPLRPRLAEARAAVGGMHTGREVWRALAERALVPAERARSSGTSPYRGAAVEGPVSWAPTPETIDDIDAWVSLASDPGGIEHASAAAVRAVEALSGWGAHAPAAVSVRWCVLPTRWDPLLGSAMSDPRHSGFGRAQRWVESATGRRADATEVYREVLAASRRGVPAARLMARDAGAASLWPSAGEAPGPAVFDALVSVWASGYALVRVDDEGAVLAAPAV